MPWDTSPEKRRRDAKTYGPEYKRAREAAKNRAGGVCEGCGHRHSRLECDHIIPGGGHSLANLRMLCRGSGTCRCHDKKSGAEGAAARNRRDHDPAPRQSTLW